MERRKEGNVLFNDALNTFYLQLYGVGHMVKDHSDSKRRSQNRDLNPVPTSPLTNDLVTAPSRLVWNNKY